MVNMKLNIFWYQLIIFVYSIRLTYQCDIEISVG